MTDGRTHWEGCYQERGHHDCVLARMDTLAAENARLIADLRFIYDNGLDKVTGEAFASVKAERDEAAKLLERVQRDRHHQLSGSTNHDIAVFLAASARGEETPTPRPKS